MVENELLFEAIRPATLYHCTGADSAESILFHNIVEAKTSHGISLPYGRVRPGFRDHEIDEYQRVSGVSLSRDPLFVKRWGSGEGVVLCFDADKIRNRFRLVPYDYYKNREESEEFLIGPLKPVNAFLTGIMVSHKTLRELQEYDDNFIEGHKPYKTLLNHPLLRVEGEAWNKRTGKDYNG